MNLNQLLWKLTEEKFTLHEVNFRGDQIYLQSFINNATYHLIKSDVDATYQTVNLFSSDKCFIYFISDIPHYIRWNQHNDVCAIVVKVDVLDTCGAMICSYFGIAFVLFFWRQRMLFTHLSKTARSRSLMDWFLTSWTFKMTRPLN